MKYIDITPDLAAKWLKDFNNNNYRRYQQLYAEYLAKKMRDGYWQRNGAPIVFDTKGQLKDGQHRLGAVVLSGITLKQWPVMYVDPSVTVFDMGRNRTWKEYTIATNSGKQVSTSIGGALSLIVGGPACHTPVSMEAKLSYYWKHSAELDMTNLFCTRGASNPITKRSGCMAAVYSAIRLQLMPNEDIETFCRIVNSGFPVDGKACESPLALRKTLMGIRAQGKVGQTVCMDVTWQALVAFSRGLKSKRTFKPNGCPKEVIEKLYETEDA